MEARTNLVLAVLLLGVTSMLLGSLSPLFEVSRDEAAPDGETPLQSLAGTVEDDAAADPLEDGTPARVESQTGGVTGVSGDAGTDGAESAVPHEDPVFEPPAATAHADETADPALPDADDSSDANDEAVSPAQDAGPAEGQEAPPEPEGPPQSRIKTSTDTLVVVTNLPERIHMNEPFEIRGELREDNNSDGNINSGDIPVPGAPVHLNFNEGSVHEVRARLMTGDGLLPQPPVGGWYINISTQETRLGNVEITCNYLGEWFDETTGLFYEDNGTLTQAFKNSPTTHLARKPSNSLPLFSDFWHYTEMTTVVETPDVTVGGNLKVSGKLKDKDVPTNKLSDRVVEMKFRGQSVAETTTDGNGNYEFNYIVPKNTPVGTWTVEVNFDSGLNWTRNRYLEDSSNTDKVRILRPTYVKFHQFAAEAVGYRAHDILINGTIVDNMNEPPLLMVTSGVGDENFLDTGTYKILLHWGRETDRYYEQEQFSLNQTSGNFSLPFTIKGTTQSVGPVNVTVEFIVDRSKGYYQDAESSNTYTVRVHTEITLELDAKENPYITRVPQDVYDPETGEKLGSEDYNVVHIKGVLKDADLSSPTNTLGIPDMKVYLWWDGNPLKGQPVTDERGQYSVAFTLETGEILGPKTVRVAFFGASEDRDFYDESEVEVTGDPFVVVALTHIELESQNVIKGEEAPVRGRLLDDKRFGISNRTVELYWRSGLNDQDGNRIQTGEPVTTDALGYFEYNKYVVPQDQTVGDAYVFAVYAGSPKPFTMDDAFIETESPSVIYNVSAYTHMALTYSDDWNVDKHFTRGEEFTIDGSLRELYQGEPQLDPVRGANVRIYLGGEFLGQTTTFNDGTINDGNFQFTGTVPRLLSTGATELMMQYQPPNGTLTYKASVNITTHDIWAQTYIQLVQGPSPDDPTRAIPDIHEEEFDEESGDFESPLEWHFKVFESDTLEDVTTPVPLGRVTMEIKSTEAVFINSTMGFTDENGNIVFNFTQPLRSTLHHGTLLAELVGGTQKIVVNVTFEGRDFLYASFVSSEANYHPPPPDEGKDNAGDEFLLLMIIAIIIIMVLVAIFLLYYLDKQRRIRKMKRIIRRARDQLIAGNEYTAVIFKSYLKLSKHLKKYGYMRNEAETFREFEDAIKVALPIDRKSMGDFLDILEEARYSSHTIGDDQRARAITNLTAVEQSLQQVIIDEAALDRMEDMETEEEVETEVIVKGGGGPPPGAPPGAPTGPPAGPPK